MPRKVATEHLVMLQRSKWRIAVSLTAVLHFQARRYVQLDAFLQWHNKSHQLAVGSFCTQTENIELLYLSHWTATDVGTKRLHLWPITIVTLEPPKYQSCDFVSNIHQIHCNGNVAEVIHRRIVLLEGR
jgi:hypothetical protein